MDERAINFRELLGWLRSHRVVAISALNAVAVLAITCVVAAVIETSATREVHAQIRDRPRPEPTIEAATLGDRIDVPSAAKRGRTAEPRELEAVGPVEVRTRRVPKAAPPEPPLTPDEDPDARLDGPPGPEGELEDEWRVE